MICWYKITKYAIDIDNIGCLEPFLPLQDHFQSQRFLGLKCKVDLTLCHIYNTKKPIRDQCSQYFGARKQDSLMILSLKSHSDYFLSNPSPIIVYLLLPDLFTHSCFVNLNGVTLAFEESKAFSVDVALLDKWTTVYFVHLQTTFCITPLPMISLTVSSYLPQTYFSKKYVFFLLLGTSI